jgi:hypothetical protein
VNLNPELPISFDRHFQVWAYTASLGRLLLRSLKGQEPGQLTSVEIMFQNVRAMQVRSAYSALQLRDATQSEIEELLRHLDKPPVPPTRFIVLGEDLYRGWVICGAVAVAENELDYTNMAELLALGGGLGVAGAEN